MKAFANGFFGVMVVAALVGGIEGGAAAAEGSQGKGASSKISAPKAEKDAFTAELKAPATCAAGKECKAEVSLKAKGTFHINDKYPLKFKVGEPPLPGVSYSKPIVKREDGAFGEKEGTLPVAFTVAKAGKTKVTGTFSFSVCSASQCQMEKVDLEVDVDVK